MTVHSDRPKEPPHVDRARKIIAQLLPEMRSHDEAIGHLYYSYPDSESVKPYAIAAALYVLDFFKRSTLTINVIDAPEVVVILRRKMANMLREAADDNPHVREELEAVADVFEQGNNGSAI